MVWCGVARPLRALIQRSAAGCVWSRVCGVFCGRVRRGPARIDGADRPAGVWRGVARRPGALIQRALGAAELSFTTALQARFAQRLLGGRFAQRSDLKCKRHG